MKLLHLIKNNCKTVFTHSCESSADNGDINVPEGNMYIHSDNSHNTEDQWGNKPDVKLCVFFKFRWKCVGGGNGLMASTYTGNSSSTRSTIKEPPSSPVGRPALSCSATLWRHAARFLSSVWPGPSKATLLVWRPERSGHSQTPLPISVFIFWCCRPSGLQMCHSMVSLFWMSLLFEYLWILFFFFCQTCEIK